MSTDQTIRLMKALADGSRVRIVQTLLEAPRYVEELAERLALSPSTVSFHLKKLEQAGVVRGVKDQYYVVYQLVDAVLDLPLRRLLTAEADEHAAGDRRQADYHARVLEAFFTEGRLQRLPAQRKKRLIVLEVFASDMEPGRPYPEPEMNALIHRRFEDHCVLRRELVGYGMVTRKAQTYRRVLTEGAALPPPTVHSQQGAPMKSRKELIREYKAAEKVAGLYRVRNTRTGRVLIGSSLNLHGPLNRHRLQLEIGSHRCATLQRDWNALGGDAFAFELVETIASDGTPGFDRAAALRALEERWIQALRPFSDHCYNTNERIRTTPF